MKKLVLLIFNILFLYSCVQDDIFPQKENITSGTKWTLQIGSSPTEVYNQLQQLGIEKNFHDVAIVHRKPFSKPEDIKSDLGLYRAITVETSSGITKRGVIHFDHGKVSSIEKGGALLDVIPKWPEDTGDDISILLNDPITTVNQKILSIYQIPKYKDYKIILSNKWLKKPFDPEMSNYNEWYFTFSSDLNPGSARQSNVSIFFQDGKLSRILHEYKDGEIFN